MVALAPAAASAASDHGRPVPSIEQRLRAVEDREAIVQLITSDYSSAIDLTDNRALAALFTDDGEFASEWIDMAALPPLLRGIFTREGAAAGSERLRPRIGFKGRAAIADYMRLVVGGRPTIAVDGAIATATFTAASAPPGPPGVPPPGPPPSAAGPRIVSREHLVTNPAVMLDGDRAAATSYWIEVAQDGDGKRTIIDSGYYTDELRRTDGGWRFQRRLIHNYGRGLAPPAPAGSPPSR